MGLTIVHAEDSLWGPTCVPRDQCRTGSCRTASACRDLTGWLVRQSSFGSQLTSNSRRCSCRHTSLTHRFAPRTRVQASSDESSQSSEETSDSSGAREADLNGAALTAGFGKGTGGTQDQKQLTLDDVNPVGLGRRSRQLFDDVWRRLVQLGQLTQPAVEEQYALPEGPNCDFTTPMAEYTTVLVAGATGRVGRVLVRKLLLRGYSVKALVRNSEAETLEKLPRSVQWVVGDVADRNTLAGAVEGCNKIIFCARANSSLSGDLTRVEQMGVDNLSRAFLDHHHVVAQRRRGRSAKSKFTFAKFNRPHHAEQWRVEEGRVDPMAPPLDVRYDGGMEGEVEFTDKGTAVFKGYVFTKGGYVEMVRPLALPDGIFLDRYEGLVLNLIGDGRSYSVVLQAKGGTEYAARFNTRLGYSRVRLPFAAFRPVVVENPPPPLHLADVDTMAIRFEPRKMGGEETDFILVSCTGAGVPEDRREKVIKAKMAGEAILRNSGLGYTIVRPGPLAEEPGGQKALVFDQGSRITQGISCADVADVCVKSLHDPTARNKTFDVCNEYTDGQGLYELVAHLPDKSNNYLTPALALLEKNT